MPAAAKKTTRVGVGAGLATLDHHLATIDPARFDYAYPFNDGRPCCVVGHASTIALDVAKLGLTDPEVSYLVGMTAEPGGPEEYETPSGVEPGSAEDHDAEEAWVLKNRCGLTGAIGVAEARRRIRVVAKRYGVTL